MTQLSELSLFQRTSESECNRMMECFQAPRRLFSSGEIIYTYGASVGLGVLQSGSAQLVKIDASGDRTVLERLGPGDAFGELLAFTSLPCDVVSVECETACTVLLFPRDKLLSPCEKGCDCHRVLMENLLNIVSRKVYQLSERIEILSCRTIREKLLCSFRIFAAQQHSTTFTLPFSLSVLADYICSDRSAMMRELKRLKEEGFLKINGRTVSFISRNSPEQPDICAASVS